MKEDEDRLAADAALLPVLRELPPLVCIFCPWRALSLTVCVPHPGTPPGLPRPQPIALCPRHGHLLLGILKLVRDAIAFAEEPPPPETPETPETPGAK